MLNERLKKSRLNANLTLLNVANNLNLSEATIQRYESGNIKNIKYQTLIDLAELYNVSPAYLLGWEEYEKKTIQEIDEIELIESIIKKLGYEIIEKTDLAGISSNEIKAEHIANKKAEEFDNNPNSLMFEVTDSNNNTFLISKSDFERLKNKMNYDIKEELENIRKYGVLNQK